MKNKTKHTWLLPNQPYINMTDTYVRFSNKIAKARDDVITKALADITSNADVKSKLSAVGNSLGEITFFYDHKKVITLTKVNIDTDRKKGTVNFGFNYYIYNHNTEETECS